MEIFHSEETWSLSVLALDDKRLGKQRLECIQILLSLSGIINIWEIPKYIHNHPVTLLWKGNEDYLLSYTTACIIEWGNRGYKNTKCISAFHDMRAITGDYPVKGKPSFITADFIQSHKIKLYSKNPLFYAKYKPE